MESRVKSREFNPHVRFCAPVLLKNDYPKPARACDHRLFFVLEGGFTVHTPKENRTVAAGGLLLIPPSVPYRLTLEEFGNSKHIIVNFDFVADRIGAPPRTVFEPNEFHEEDIYSREAPPAFKEVFTLDGTPFCKDILLAMCEEMQNEREGASDLLSGLCKTLLTLLMREKERHTPTDRGDILCEQVKAYINTAFSTPIDNATLARRFGYHPYYLNSLFKKKTGQTLRSYIIDRRLAEAKILLLRGDATVAEIGQACGFTGASYFSECFSARFGISPKEYREQGR